MRAREGRADWKRLEEELESLDKKNMGEGADTDAHVREVLARWVAGYREAGPDLIG